jgi:UDP:flavonoid glycosyltransferase YjiC (YdhE family)
MNILILAIGSYGDVLPLVGLGREFCSRGHDVKFFTNRHFGSLIQQAGMNFVALGSADDYDDMVNNPALWHPHKGWRLIMKRLVSGALENAYTLLKSKVVQGNTLIISSTLGFAARLIQETHHIPHVTVHFSPGVFHSAHQAPKVPGLPLPDWLPVTFKQGIWKFLDHTMIDPVVKSKLNRFRRRLGLPPVSRIFHDWLHSPDLVLGLFPEWFAAPQPDWPPQTRVTGFPLFDDAHDNSLPSEVQDFLKQGSLPLVFTPGSAMKHGGKFFAEATRACQLSGHRGIFLTRYPEQLPPFLPKEVKHFSYVPLSQLLPHAAALIHHGGIGTCSQALRAGIPQIIQPSAFDQFDNAARVKRLGVGTMISKRSFRAPRIAQHLQAMLSSSDVKTQCQKLQNHFQGKDPLRESYHLIETTFGLG